MVIQTFLFVLIPLVFVGILLKLNELFKWKHLETFFTKLDSMILDHKTRRKLVLEVYLILLVLLVALFSFGNGKPIAKGNEYSIKVLADSTDWGILEELVTTIFERPIHTPQPEKMFNVFRFDEKTLNTFRKDRQIIILGTLQTKGKIGELIRSEIANRKIGLKITNENQFLFNIGAKWAEGQNVVLLVGENINSLKKQIEQNSEFLFSYFERLAGNIFQEELFSGSLEQELVNDVYKKYAWTFSNLAELRIQMERPKQNFILFGTTIMDRWLFVNWIENADTSMLNSDWIRQRRNIIGKTFIEGQTVEDHFLQSFKTSFLDRPAIITSGLWARNDIVIGGPFKNYTFYDEDSKRIYMIDTFAFNPGKKKLPLLKRLDVIVHTFKTDYEVTE